MGLEAATVATRDGQRIVVIAVRPELLRDEQRRQGVLDALSVVFPNHPVVLAASTSSGPQLVAEQPEVADAVRKKGLSRLTWQQYSFAV